jgi:uncharacterized membrane protein
VDGHNPSDRCAFRDLHGGDRRGLRSDWSAGEETQSLWNLLFATAAIFVAIIFGQVEAGLAEPYGASRTILDWHSTLGWSLAGILSVLTGWRYVLRNRDPQTLPLPFLAAGGVLALLVVVQVTLGNQLIWVYGLHTVPVVEAQRAGLIG